MPTVPPVDTERLAGLVRPEEPRESRSITAPATEERLGTIPECQPADVGAAVDRARDAQKPWADRPLEARVGVLREVHDRVIDERGRLMDVLQAETAKSRTDAFEEVLDIAVNARYYANRADEFLRSASRRGAIPLVVSATEHRHPKGIVGLITPWNYPLSLSVSDALPALLAGNTVVCKPAESTPYAALSAAELLAEAGVPRDCFQIVTGPGERLGEPLIERVDAVEFTGSTAVGRVVAEQAGRHLVETSLELGGKNPMVVLADADVERAARLAVDDCFANAGQLCVSMERIYVESPAFEQFRDAFVAATRAARVGVGTDWDVDVGSLQSADQLRRVEAHLSDALDRGATLLTGGRHRPDLGPFVFEPTVLTDVPPDATLRDEETFGPVVRLERVPDAETAVERANDSAYGLNASVWSGDRERGAAVAEQIDCGTVTVNDAYRTVWASVDGPMGGRGDSGMGRRHGRQGIEKYVDAQTVAVQRGPPMKPPGLPNDLWTSGIAAALRAYHAVTRRFP